jgi:hypothetical protein
MTVHRAEYDASAAFAKTRRAGLLPRSSFFPAASRDPLKCGVRALGLYELMKRSAW